MLQANRLAKCASHPKSEFHSFYLELEAFQKENYVKYFQNEILMTTATTYWSQLLLKIISGRFLKAPWET